MSSPKRGEGLGYRCPEQAHVSIKTSAPLSTSQGQQLLQHKDHSTKKQQERASREQLVPLVGFAVGNNTDLGKTASSVGFSFERGNRMLLERSVLGLTPLRGQQGWSRAAPRVMRPVSTTGWLGLRRGRTSTGNLLDAAGDTPAPASRSTSGAASGLPRPCGSLPTPGSRDRGATARPPARSRRWGSRTPPGENAESARRRPALTGPAPSPVPDDLPQQRQRLPRRVLGARPLPAAPQPRREGLDLLGELRAALRSARHGGGTSASAAPPPHWRRLPSCARPPAAARPMSGASGGWAGGAA